MEFCKTSFLIVACLGCCLGAPGLIRVLDEKDIPDGTGIRNRDEVTLASKGGSSTGAQEEEENGNLGEDTLGEILRNGISGGQMSYEEEVPSPIVTHDEVSAQIIPVSLPKSPKSTIDIKNPISAHKKAISKMTGVDPYEKLLESFIRGIMSRVLQAEIKEVRVEEMGHSKRKKTVYY